MALRPWILDGGSSLPMASDHTDACSPTSRVVRSVLVLDVVESVRLMEEDEEDTIRRWRALVERVTSEVLPAHEGHLVKSLGDGLMADFPDVQRCIRAAFAIQRLSDRANASVTSARRMLLRLGVHVGELIADGLDVYGHDVNLAARLTTLAGPGEIVVSADVRDQLTPLLDADVEDLGECYVKHVREPIRAYRVGPPGPRPVIEPSAFAAHDLRPTVAVIPFTARTLDPEHHVVGEIIADEVIAALSRAQELQVISRLSTTAFRGREAGLKEVSEHLQVNYVLSGAYRVFGGKLTLVAELAEAKSGRIAWAENLKGNVEDVARGEDELIDHLVAQVAAAVMASELERAQSLPLPTLESYTLLMSAISLMHRLSTNSFERAREMLQTLIERAPRRPAPLAWLAKWHVLRAAQGWTNNPAQERRLALECSRRALDADPDHSLALAMDGLVHANLLGRFDVASERYERAIAVMPSESVAWLLKGTLHAFKGEGEAAVDATERALRLSPLDPLRYYYDSLAATAALSAAHYERAIELARRSLTANRLHASSWRALVIAHSLLGQAQEASEAAAKLMRLEPTLTVRKYREQHPTRGYETNRIWSDALEKAGVPRGTS